MQDSIKNVIEREISNKYKKVVSFRIEEDIQTDRIYCGEYMARSYALIVGRDDSYSHTGRPVLNCFIRFVDDTGIFLKLKPEDYLSKTRTRDFPIKTYFGSDGGRIVERDFDYNKILETILSALNGERIQNCSLEMLDIINATN